MAGSDIAWRRFADVGAAASALSREVEAFRVAMARPPVCRDFDEDCDDIADKVRCYLYDPAKGRCPFLAKP